MTRKRKVTRQEKKRERRKEARIRQIRFAPSDRCDCISWHTLQRHDDHCAVWGLDRYFNWRYLYDAMGFTQQYGPPVPDLNEQKIL